MLRAVTNPRVAFCAAAFVACLWCNQGPSARRYEALAASAGAPSGAGLAPALVRAWLPVAFLYRRSADEELYFAVANAIRGAPYDRELLLQKRGESSPAFRRMPVADGHFHMPYTEVPFEYPALVLPFILLPAALATSFDAFAPLFGALMGALLLAALHLAIASAPARGAADRAAMWIGGAALLLAQGGLAIQRLDAIATLFLALALWAGARKKPALLGFAIALAAAVKVTPLLILVPLCAALPETWRTRRAALSVLGGTASGLALGFLPMLIVAPRGFGEFLAYHTARGLQIESTYGTLLSIAQRLAGAPSAATLSFGSYNLGGPAAAFFARAASWILLAATALFAVHVARAAGAARGLAIDDRRWQLLAMATLGGAVCIWLCGKVFSPQYLTWGIPLAVGLSPRRIPLALGATMAVAQAYLRGFYDHVVDMRPLGVAALALRTALLIVLAVALWQAVARAMPGARPASDPSS
jgi:hypothetical protein